MSLSRNKKLERILKLQSEYTRTLSTPGLGHHGLLPAFPTFRRMLKTAVHDGPEQLRLEEEVPEARAVDGDVGALHLLLASGCNCLWGDLLLLVIFIVEQLVVNIILSHATNTERSNG